MNRGQREGDGREKEHDHKVDISMSLSFFFFFHLSKRKINNKKTTTRHGDEWKITTNRGNENSCLVFPRLQRSDFLNLCVVHFPIKEKKMNVKTQRLLVLGLDA